MFRPRDGRSCAVYCDNGQAVLESRSDFRYFAQRFRITGIVGTTRPKLGEGRLRIAWPGRHG
jgi:hypothetical protein